MKGTKVKSNKGITLVALVITIIILLILAVVAITAVNGDGIIGKAKEAGSSYNEKAGEENTELARQLGLIEGALGEKTKANGGWTDNGDGTFTKGSVTVAVGDYVNYNEGTGTPYTPDIAKGAGTSCIDTNEDLMPDTLQTSEVSTEDLNWRVLGIDENGRLELISAESTTAQLALCGAKGYKNAETVINEMCNSLYGKGTGAASARSLNIEDIYKFDPTRDNPTYWKYGYADGYVRVKQATDENDKDFSDISTWDKSGVFMMGTMQMGTPQTEMYGIDEDGTEWKIDAEHSTLTKVLKTSSNIMYGLGENNKEELFTPTSWLASHSVDANALTAFFYVRLVNSGHVSLSNLYNSGDGAYGGSWAVRPVVTLKSDVQLTSDGTNTWKLGN